MHMFLCEITKYMERLQNERKQNQKILFNYKKIKLKTNIHVCCNILKHRIDNRYWLFVLFAKYPYTEAHKYITNAHQYTQKYTKTQTCT